MELISLINPRFEQTSFTGVVRGQYLSFFSGIVFYEIEERVFYTPVQERNWAFPTLKESVASIDVEGVLSKISNESYNLPILSSPFSTNYYHFTLECIPALRHLEYRQAVVAIPPILIEAPYQQELLAFCLNGRKAAILDGCELHRDPILSWDYITKAGVEFVRRSVNHFAKPGNDVVYISRGPSLTRKQTGGSVRETPEFLDLLESFNARRINFGSGQLRLFDQIDLLDGARTIIATHGAALTNLIYLEPPLNVIELVVPPWDTRVMYEDICHDLGFSYSRLICPIDTQGDLVVDTHELERLVCEGLEQALSL